ncbi:hypothetical protein BDDG_13176, partial [Blastomyces dermatitidis ATCC 18188]
YCSSVILIFFIFIYYFFIFLFFFFLSLSFVVQKNVRPSDNNAAASELLVYAYE